MTRAEVLGLLGAGTPGVGARRNGGLELREGKLAKVTETLGRGCLIRYIRKPD